MKPIQALTVAAALAIAGCGTLFIPRTVDVNVNSNPVQANVTIDGILQGTTPLVIELDNKQAHTILISKEGHSTVTCVLNTRVSGTMIVLDVLAGFVPIIIDAATGGWRKLDSTVCSVTLPEN